MLSPQNKKILLNAACTGVIAGLAVSYLLGEAQEVNYFGMSVPANIASAAGCAVGSIVSDLTSEMVIRRLGLNNQIQNLSIMGVEAGVGGAASAGVLYLGGMPSTGLIGATVIGAASKLGGNYANQKLFDPREGIIGPIF